MSSECVQRLSKLCAVSILSVALTLLLHPSQKILAAEYPQLVSVTDVPIRVEDPFTQDLRPIADISADSGLNSILLLSHLGGANGAFEIYKSDKGGATYSSPTAVTSCRLGARVESSTIQVSPDGEWLIAASVAPDSSPNQGPDSPQNVWNKDRDRVIVDLLNLTRPSPSSICIGARTFTDKVSKGTATVAFSASSDRFVIAIPGAAAAQGSGQQWGVTKAWVASFANTGGDLWQQSLVSIPSLEGAAPVNAGLGSSASISSDGAVISMFIDAGRRKQSEVPGLSWQYSVPGGWIPEPNSRTPSQAGILIMEQGAGHHFFAAPRHVTNAPFAALPRVQGDRLSSSHDGETLLYGVTTASGEFQLHSFRRIPSGGWSQSILELTPQHLQSCTNSQVGNSQIVDLTISGKGDRAAALFSAGQRLFICLWTFDGTSWALATEGLPEINAELLAKWPTNQVVPGQYYFLVSEAVDRVLVSDGTPAKVIDMGWEAELMTGLPIWLLFEASKSSAP